MKITVVTDEIRDRVMSRELGPGLHLQEIMLAEELGVSRTPIRSALSTLHQEGLLDYLPKRGYFVKDHAPEEVLQAWTFRGSLEGIACRIIAETEATPSLKDELCDALKIGVDILRDDDLSAEDVLLYREMNNKFHNGIVKASGNRFLIEAMGRFRHIPVYVQLLERYYSTELSSPVRLITWLRRMHDDHHRIAEAIFKRQSQRAEALMIEHHYYASQYITDRMK